MSIEQAIALHRQGRLGEAEPIYRSVLSLNPDEYKPLYLLGTLKLQQGNSEEAVRLLTAAITRNPNASEALATLAAALNSLGRHEEALAAFDKILQGEPDDVQTLYNRGVVLSALGREEEAVIELRRRAAGQSASCAVAPQSRHRLGKTQTSRRGIGRLREISPRGAE